MERNDSDRMVSKNPIRIKTSRFVNDIVQDIYLALEVFLFGYYIASSHQQISPLFFLTDMAGSAERSGSRSCHGQSDKFNIDNFLLKFFSQ